MKKTQTKKVNYKHLFGYDILKKFPENIRKEIMTEIINAKGIDRLDLLLYNQTFASASNFLMCAFIWAESKEGDLYWISIDVESRKF